nr:MAG TPA: hypothetical protein [Caudoviricetes sp.]
MTQRSSKRAKGAKERRAEHRAPQRGQRRATAGKCRIQRKGGRGHER